MSKRIVVLCVLVALVFGQGCGRTNRKATAKVPPAVGLREMTFDAEGVVRYPDGSPAAGVTVYATRQTAPCDYAVAPSIQETERWQLAGSVTCGKDGRFVFKSLRRVPYPEYCLFAFCPNRFLGWIRTNARDPIGSRCPRPRCTGLDIQMYRLGSFAGRVVDGTGKPVSGVEIEIDAVSFRRNYLQPAALNPILTIRKAMSGADGKYVLHGVPQGADPMIIARKPGYVQYPGPYETKADRVVMVLSGRIAGRVVDENGRGIPSTGVWATGPVRYPASRPTTTNHGYLIGGGPVLFSYHSQTDAEGRYIVDVHPCGRYRVSAESDGQPWVSKSVYGTAITEGRVAKVRDIVVTQGVSLRGRLLDASSRKPIVGRVHLRPISYASENVRSATSGRDGSFEFRVLPGETYRMHYEDLGMYLMDSAASRTVEVGPKGTSEADLGLHKISTAKGRVLDEYGKPVEGAAIRIVGYEAALEIAPRYGQAVSGPNGWFEIGVPPWFAKRDAIIVIANVENRRIGIAAKSNATTLLHGQLLVRLRPAKELTATVLDSKGKPCIYAWTGLFVQAGGTRDWVETVRTDENGKARFDVYPGGEYKLEGFHDKTGLKFASSTLPSPDSPKWTGKVTLTPLSGKKTARTR